MGGRVAESPAPQGEEVGGRDREVDRGGRSEGTGRGGDVEEFGQIRRGKVVDGLERKREDFEVYAEPVTGSQWSCCRTGVMWWMEGVLVRIQAAAEF